MCFSEEVVRKTRWSSELDEDHLLRCLRFDMKILNGLILFVVLSEYSLLCLTVELK